MAQTKSFVAAALLGIALILLAVVVVIIPASAVGQCGEKSCGRFFTSDCASNQRCVSRYGGYYCVDDPACSSTPSTTGTPTTAVTTTTTTTTTATPAPSPTGSSCSSAGGTCRYWTGFYCYSGETDVGKKDCGSGKTCCYKAATPKVTPTQTPVPKMTPTPAVPGTCAADGGSCESIFCRSVIAGHMEECGSWRRCCRPTSLGCGLKNCRGSFGDDRGKYDCQPYENCKLIVEYGFVNRGYKCVPDPACNVGAPLDSGSPCGNGVCETGGVGKETYQTCPQDCPKPNATGTTTTTIAKCSDGTPRFYCSNSTPGKYCDGLGKLVTLARCSAAAPTPEPTLAPTAIAGHTYTKILDVRIFKKIEWAGNYGIIVTATDTTTRRASITVHASESSVAVPVTQSKILDEGSTYTFFGDRSGGGVKIKVNAVIKNSADLTITYAD